MSDQQEPGFLDIVMGWLRTPDPERKKRRPDWEKDRFEKDEIWRDFHLFHGDWVEVINKKEWYDSPHVPQIYKDHKKIVKQNMGMKRPFETFYFENPDSGSFASEMYAEDNGLPSGNGNFRLEIEISLPGGPPSGENDACLVEYFVRGRIKYDVPNGIDYLPRIISYPLNRFFKWAFLKFIARDQIEYDGEYAKERVNEYFQYLRKYHGEEPLQAKSRHAEFRPVVDKGVFFQ